MAQPTHGSLRHGCTQVTQHGRTCDVSLGLRFRKAVQSRQAHHGPSMHHTPPYAETCFMGVGKKCYAQNAASKHLPDILREDGYWKRAQGVHANEMSCHYLRDVECRLRAFGLVKKVLDVWRWGKTGLLVIEFEFSRYWNQKGNRTSRASAPSRSSSNLIIRITLGRKQTSKHMQGSTCVKGRQIH